MKKIGVYLGLIIFFSFGIIGSLLLNTWHHLPNGFNRIVNNADLIEKQTFDLPAKDFFFAGDITGAIYLKHRSESDVLYTIGFNLEKLSAIKLNSPQVYNSKKKNIKIGTIDSTFFISDGSNKQFAVGYLKDFSRIYYKTPNSVFDEPILIAPNSVIVRQVSLINNNLQRSFLKFNLIDTNKLVLKALENQVDGFFSNDGLLQYDNYHKLLIYTFFYQGRFMCIDTNLHGVYIAKTIDTVNIADIKLKTITSGNKLGVGTSFLKTNPPRFINKNFTIYGNYMLMMSGLKADNESNSTFNTHQVIDVYRITDGKYLSSFYVKLYHGINLREFRVNNGDLYCLFENHLVVYNSSLSFLKKKIM